MIFAKKINMIPVYKYSKTDAEIKRDPLYRIAKY